MYVCIYILVRARTKVQSLVSLSLSFSLGRGSSSGALGDTLAARLVRPGRSGGSASPAGPAAPSGWRWKVRPGRRRVSLSIRVIGN